MNKKLKGGNFQTNANDMQTTSRKQELERAISIIKANRINFTDGSLDWFKIGRALACEFGEEGRGWFHLVNQLYKNYNEHKCNFQYDQCLNYNEKPTIASFFYYCKKRGIEYWKEIW